MKNFLKKAFTDMKASAAEQHKVDRANFAAAKAESKARWEEAKTMGSPTAYSKALQTRRDEECRAAEHRAADAEARIKAAQDARK